MLLLWVLVLVTDGGWQVVVRMDATAGGSYHHLLLSRTHRMLLAKICDSSISTNSSTVGRGEGGEGPGGLLMLLLKDREIEGCPPAFGKSIDMEIAFIFTKARVDGSSSRRSGSVRGRGNT